MTPSPEPAGATGAKMRLAAIGDLHVGENHPHPYRELFSKISQEADCLALCGDLTNFGKTPEIGTNATSRDMFQARSSGGTTATPPSVPRTFTKTSPPCSKVRRY